MYGTEITYASAATGAACHLPLGCWVTLPVDALAAATVIAFILATILVLVAYFDQKQREFCKQFSGVFFVVALAFASNNDGVYAVAIFIIASIITKLEFLENLAALFWGRDKFWDYRNNQLTAATPNEIEEKRQEEVSVLVEAQPANERRLSDSEIKQKALDFENAAIAALVESGLFRPGAVRSNVRLEAGGLRHIADAIAAHGDKRFVIEAKFASNASNLSRWMYQLGSLMAIYDTLLGRKISKGLLIVPSNIEAPDFPGEAVATLKLDLASGRFTNTDLVRTWILQR